MFVLSDLIEQTWKISFFCILMVLHYSPQKESLKYTLFIITTFAI